MTINEFVKQKTDDGDFQSLKGIIQPTILAYNFVVGARQSVTLDMVMKTEINEMILEPYMRAYILAKEQKLSKSRLLFTEKERNETLEELEELYQNLKKKGIVY